MRARDAQGPIPLPEDEDNDVAMQEVVVQEMEVKHEAERDLLIEVHRSQDDWQRALWRVMAEWSS